MRILISIALACLLGLASIGLALLPNAFNSLGIHYNRNLHLTWFLGCSLQGLLAASLWALTIHFRSPSASTKRLLLVIAVVALFAVVVPCPAILDGAWADRLVGVYALFTWSSAAFCAWTFQQSRAARAHDPADGTVAASDCESREE